MEELYDPTENSVIGTDVAYTWTLSETDEIFTQDIIYTADAKGEYV